MEKNWESFVLRLRNRASECLHNGRRGSHAKVTAHAMLDHDGKPVLWVVPFGEPSEGAANTLSWDEFVEFAVYEAKTTLGKSRDGLCIVTFSLIIGRDSRLYAYKIGVGLRIEPANNAKEIIERLLKA